MFSNNLDKIFESITSTVKLAKDYGTAGNGLVIINTFIILEVLELILMYLLITIFQIKRISRFTVHLRRN